MFEIILSSENIRNVRRQDFLNLMTANSKQWNCEVAWAWIETLIIRDQELSRIWIQSQRLGLGIEMQGVKDTSRQYA